MGSSHGQASRVAALVAIPLLATGCCTPGGSRPEAPELVCPPVEQILAAPGNISSATGLESVLPSLIDDARASPAGVAFWNEVDAAIASGASWLCGMEVVGVGSGHYSAAMVLESTDGVMRYFGSSPEGDSGDGELLSAVHARGDTDVDLLHRRFLAEWPHLESSDLGMDVADGNVILLHLLCRGRWSSRVMYSPPLEGVWSLDWLLQNRRRLGFARLVESFLVVRALASGAASPGSEE